MTAINLDDERRRQHRPPTLTLPSLRQLQPVEGNTTSGWTADWSGVVATDPEDDPDPTPTCTPAAGSVAARSVPNHVSCSVTDSGGLTATGGLQRHRRRHDRPGARRRPGRLRASPPAIPPARTLAYATPTATDIVDPSPDVTLLHRRAATHVGAGTTTVTCTATDASGNSAARTFDVTVTLEAHPPAPLAGPIDVSDTWLGEPGRTVPIKVRLFDGEPRAATLPIKVDAVRRRRRAADQRRRRCCTLARRAPRAARPSGTAWCRAADAGSVRLDTRGAEPAHATRSPADDRRRSTAGSSTTSSPPRGHAKAALDSAPQGRPKPDKPGRSDRARRDLS